VAAYGAYDLRFFAGLANKVGGGLRLRAFHGGLRRLTTAALWSNGK